MHKYTSKDS
jgi:hypothetical protein